MRTTFIRSAVAIAALAIGSAALAVPAQAATPSGVTRDMVLTAANGARMSDSNGWFGYSEETYVALRSIVNRGCGIDYDAGDDLNYIQTLPVADPGEVDGAVLYAYIQRYDEDTDNTTYRACLLGVAATTDASFSLSGTASLTGTLESNDLSVRAVETLSGDVFVSKPLIESQNQYYSSVSFTASGNAVKGVTASSRSKVPDIKSEAQKKAAKKTYERRIASAKKAYAKALDKADTKAEKSAAKKAYKAKRALVKAKYQYAVADFKIVTKPATRTESRPFSLKAGFDESELN